jgi:hypothetical protein
MCNLTKPNDRSVFHCPYASSACFVNNIMLQCACIISIIEYHVRACIVSILSYSSIQIILSDYNNRACVTLSVRFVSMLCQ